MLVERVNVRRLDYTRPSLDDAGCLVASGLLAIEDTRGILPSRKGFSRASAASLGGGISDLLVSSRSRAQAKRGRLIRD